MFSFYQSLNMTQRIFAQFSIWKLAIIRLKLLIGYLYVSQFDVIQIYAQSFELD